MASTLGNVKTLDDILAGVREADISAIQCRDMTSAIKRICEMARMSPASVLAEASILRPILRTISPATHGVSQKSWANMRSRLRAALELAGAIDSMGRGCAMRHPAWAPLLQIIAGNQALSNGLASFANWCAVRDAFPEHVGGLIAQEFYSWLDTRTLCLRPRDVARSVPKLWNKASFKFDSWPRTKLTTLSFKAPRKRLPQEALSESFQRDAQSYIAMRANPDVFDERPNAPRRRLATSTLHQQGLHLRLAASVLVESGVPVEEIASLADLTQPERFKIVLRYYIQRVNGQSNAFATCLAKTLIQVAQYQVGATPDEVAQLKRIASKLPVVPHELTPKNKALLRQFESERLRAKLLFLPDELMAEVAKDLETGRLSFVKAQVALAIDFQLAIPLRPQNLSSLNWRRHFTEPDGPKGRLLLHIPAAEMKSRRQDYTAEVQEHVAQRLRWYRRHILSRLNADVNGDLFVTKKGTRKDQKTIAIQIIRTIAERLGIHMTPHQFRHLAGASYLDENPEDIETPRALLGHAWSKTTLIYVGSSSRRASRAYNRFVFQKRDALKLMRKRQLKRKPKKGTPPCAS